jgi:ring-1,2-phenylacetyl-CoA epoxidase subunit PaaD
VGPGGARRGSHGGSRVTDHVALEAAVRRAVGAVPDPELGGVSIGDLGLVAAILVRTDGSVLVELTPTFLGCPALALIEADVCAAALGAGAADAVVRWVHAPMWSPSRISARGRSLLGALGIAAPSAPGTTIACPLCGAPALSPSSPVGATACRSVLWCSACRNVVELMRGADRSEPIVLGPSRSGPRTHAHL